MNAPLTRRRLLQAGLAAAAAPHPARLLAQPPVRQGGPARGVKKGYAIGSKQPQWASMAAALHAHWVYNWTAVRPRDLPEGIDWVPMIAKDNPNGAAETALAAVQADLPNKPTALLGFNEPDQAEQANMTVERAVELWPKLQELNLPLGSPAGVHADGEWMQRFMKEAFVRRFRIDFVTIHWYGGPNADQLLGHLDKVARLYRLPLWITEFCPADWNAAKTGRNQHSERDVLRFMLSALPRLERTPYVQRYAWFSAAPDSPPLGCSALFDAQGQLTNLGRAYAEIG